MPNPNERVAGRLNGKQEACVYVAFANGKMVEFAVDTAFDGALAVPRSLAGQFGWETRSKTSMKTFGRKRARDFEVVYERIFWFGQEELVEIIISEDDDDQLLGIHLLANKILRINYETGTVTITAAKKKH